MIVISNSSPLVALSSVDQLDIFARLFHQITIPISVYQETVLDNPIISQRTRIAAATESFIEVVTPQIVHQFERKLGKGEQGVLNLALEMKPDLVLLDDKKARNEAISLGLTPAFTSDVLRLAAEQKIIPSYQALMTQLVQEQIYLPE